MIVCIDHQQRAGAGAGIRLSPDGDSPPSIFDGGDLLLDADSVAGEDFGGIVRRRPAAVSRPSTAADVSRVIQLAARSDSLTVAARGNGHSIHGQAMADGGGVVLDMRSLGSRMELVVSGAGGAVYADVAGGALWEELLAWSVAAHGMAPASWTDYLGLTVGGTLSNGGVSGQAFRHGPQVANVVELEVVTGDGECHVCSPAELPDLFFAALGGLGQFGVITRARIPLLPAPDMVRWMRVVYGRFEDYAADAEWVLTWRESGSFDYVEGFALVNGDDLVNGWGSVPLRAGSRFDPRLVPAGSGPLLYCLEVALHYNRGDGGVDERAGEMLRRLRHVRGLEFTTDVSYVEFLSRVNRAEEEARANGSWFAPHPWLNLLVSAADIADFDRCVLKRILKDGVGGPMLVYPMLRCKWDPRASAAVPESSEVFYLVALLRFGPLSAAAEMVAQNREIIACCDARGYDYKMYLPHYETEREWSRHFGPEGWPRFVERKARYDPLRLLAPGQKIFSRALPLPALEPAPVPAPPM